MAQRTVPDEGRLDATLVVVGEAPSTTELARRRPFVGPSGGKLAEWWKRDDVKIERKDTYITNVFPYQVNKVMKGGTHGLDVTVEAWNEAVTDLHRRLAQLTHPQLIVAVGDVALNALRGHGGILKWRGSILVYEPNTCRLIPVIHPAALFRDPTLEHACIADWIKIAREWRTPSTPATPRHHIAPSFAEVQAFRKRVQQESARELALRSRLTVDIETPRKMKTVAALTPKLKRPTTKKVPGTPFIGCVGFALSPDESITIPTMAAYWKQYGIDMADVWHEIAAICESNLPKVLQNGFFDAFYFLRDRSIHKHLGRGIRLRNYKHDTLAKHHVLRAEDAHDLGWINATHGRRPFWKDDGKQSGDIRAVPPDLEKWWRYNGTDCTETHYLDARLDEELAKLGRTQFYRDHYQKCFQPILGMMEDGLLCDDELRAQRAEELDEQLQRLTVKINEAAGVNLMGKMSLSPTKLKTLLYTTWKLPKQFAKNARKEKVESAGEIQLKKLMNKFPAHEDLQRVGKLVLKFRRADKLRMFFAEKTVDSDNRTRCSVTFETDTGRLSMRKNPMGGGLNFQAFDHEARQIYVADPGGVFVEGDLSQAEARIVYCLTKDPDLIAIARLMPWEYDTHSENTKLILGKGPEHYSEAEWKSLRKNVGKPTAHAGHYGQMGPTMSDSLLKKGIVMDPWECQRHIDAYMAKRPAVLEWQKEIKWRVIDKRELTNSWGRVADFRYMRLQPHLYQKAFNFIPQSEVGGIINQYGMIPIHRAIRQEGMAHRLRLQIHDALLYWSPATVEDVWWLICQMRQNLEQPRVYESVELMIPLEIKIGRRWGSRKGETDVIEFKQPPTKKDVRLALEQLQEEASA